MKGAAILLVSVTAMPATADTLVCEVVPPCPVYPCSDVVSIRFAIDHTQFAPAQDANDPPRRKVTLVEMGTASFPAEALIMGDLRGFWAESDGGGNILFVVHPDGRANYAEQPSGTRMEGTCSG